MRDRAELAENDLRSLLALHPVQPSEQGDDAPVDTPPAYCRWLEKIQGVTSPKTAEAQRAAQPPLPKGPAVAPAAQTPAPRPPVVQAAPIPKPAIRRPAVQRPAAVPRPVPAGPLKPSTPVKAPKPITLPPPRPQLSNWAQVATAKDRALDADRQADRYSVEVHKKWAISMACVSFVIVGIVMALRFPRGGIGLVIGGGLLVFSVHYVGLTAGESLADRGLMSPWLAMWLPNIILTVVGLLGLIRVSRESGSTRGGDFQEVLDGLRHVVRLVRRRGRAGAAR